MLLCRSVLLVIKSMAIMLMVTKLMVTTMIIMKLLLMILFREELDEVVKLLGEEKRDGTCRVMTLGGRPHDDDHHHDIHDDDDDHHHHNHHHDDDDDHRNRHYLLNTSLSLLFLIITLILHLYHHPFLTLIKYQIFNTLSVADIDIDYQYYDNC